MSGASGLGVFPVLPEPGRPPRPRPSEAASLALPWRAEGILVYAQSGEQPSASDEMLATFTDPDVAAAAVRAHNAAIAGL